jgi:hypothetical protein
VRGVDYTTYTCTFYSYDQKNVKSSALSKVFKKSHMHTFNVSIRTVQSSNGECQANGVRGVDYTKYVPSTYSIQVKLLKFNYRIFSAIKPMQV